MSPCFRHALFALSALGVGAGVVGAQQLSTAFVDDFEGVVPTHFVYGSGGNQAGFTHQSGVASAVEPETDVLRLTIDTADGAGAWQGPNFNSRKLCHFGTYTARLRVPDATAQPKAGAVVGFYTYYNDTYGSDLPKDENGNGLPDNSEIDFEWLVADPQVIYLTAYTDYDDATGNTRKVGRVINLAKGTIYSTIYAERLGTTGTRLTGVENTPESIPAVADYDPVSRFYTYGFDWHPDRIRWWILLPGSSVDGLVGDTLVLWDYRGPTERITQKPARLMINLWHTRDWPVQTVPGSIEKPTIDLSLEVDRVSYTPSGETSSLQKKSGKGSRVSLSVREERGNGFSLHVPLRSASAELIDVVGRTVARQQISGTSTEVIFGTALPLKPGRYWLRVNGEWGSDVLPVSVRG